MSQLELPPISIARYFDLVKRRRWQVLPMSAAGLVLGALVAFLIPRYYVATAETTYVGALLDPKARTDTDPMYLTVLGAKLSVPAAIPATLQKLEIIGENRDDPARQQTIDSFLGRTTISAGAIERGKTDYRIQITYKDVDGARAALFANTLRDVWVEQILADFDERSAKERREARDTVRERQAAFDAIEKQITQFRREHGLDPSEESGMLTAVDSRSKRLATELQLLNTLTGEIVALNTQIDQLQHSINDGEIPRTIEKQEPIADDPAFAELVTRLKQEVNYNKEAMEGFVPGTEAWQTYQERYRTAEAALVAVVPPGSEAGMRIRVVENPDYRDALKRLNELRLDRDAKAEQKKIYERSVEQLRSELAVLPEIYESYERLLSRRIEAQQALTDANTVAATRDTLYNSSRTNPSLQKTVRAEVPPAPTDPNVFLVAAIGGVLGLGIAIGLVLVLDILRSTFKTVEDVNYGLRLPVLGVMAHLETDEVRQQVVRKRRTVSIVISVFLLLVLSIVAVYYIAPLRLPPPVFRVLDAILGGNAAR